MAGEGRARKHWLGPRAIRLTSRARELVHGYCGWPREFTKMFEVREKPKMVERAFLVGVAVGNQADAATQALLEELAELVGTIGIGIVGQVTVRIREPHPRYLLGSGKMEEILAQAAAVQADCLVLDAELSPAQQRNWEAASQLCVIDRHEVILDIFNERAQTREAVLQVQLARAEHSLPRLKNAWSHLSRQRGGGGVTQRGEGEAQIELDARMVRTRIARLKTELAAVVRHRDTQRKQRQRVPVPTAAIVGYTNAGKSTLLNALTGAHVLAADKLFATLDPTTRQTRLPSGQKLLLTDTVGFVRRLPHQLVDAFKATLEEALVAEFLIHVVDFSNPEFREHYRTTLQVLAELGADDKRLITVFNKIDRCDRPIVLPDGFTDAFAVSAVTGEGMEALVQRFEDLLRESMVTVALYIPFDRHELVGLVHAQGHVLEQRSDENGSWLVARVPCRMVAQFEPFIHGDRRLVTMG